MRCMQCAASSCVLTVLIVQRVTGCSAQWLVFRNDGTTTAAQYAQAAAQGGRGGGGLLGMLQPDRLQQRQAFVQRLLRQTLTGLAYMHARFR